MDFSAIKPIAGKGLSRRQATRTATENPFITEGYLLASYERGVDYELTVPGSYVDYDKRTKDKTTGVVTTSKSTKLTGDAAEVVNMLRRAANELNIGVRVEVVPGARKGTYTVKYLGVNRKKSAAKADDAT